MLTEKQLKEIFPKIQPDKLKLYAEAFAKTLPAMGLNNPKRIAAFLGQIGVESGELRYTKELPSKYNKKDPKDTNEPVGTLYEGRKILGNLQAGDGPRFIGRGILQLTGRANYTTYSKKLNVDLINNPELACDPIVSTKIACQYFIDRGLLELADKWNLDEITKKVNGSGMLHHKERVAYSEKALKVLEAKV